MIECEAGALGREVEDREVLAASEVEQKRSEVHAAAMHAWEHLVVLTQNIPERDRALIQSLLFRDFYHILEVYLAHVRAMGPPSVSLPRPSAAPKDTPPAEFTEWLFKL